MINIIIPLIYLRIIETLCKIIVFFGGRGGGKTEGISRLFLCVAYQFGGITIFCARETQDEFCTTLMLVFKDIVRNDTQFQWMRDHCTFYKDRIEFHNGSVIYFMGLSEKTQDKVKGIKANFFWFDEAHDLGKDTYELLIPSIREHNSKVVISFNTRYDYDFVSEEFLKNPAPNVEVIQVNAKDNPYLSEDLKNQMEVDKVRLPYEEYLWKWEGGFKPQSDTALFDLNTLKNSFYLKREFCLEDFTRIVVGIDPATTSKDYSNQSGLVVAGLNLEGEAVLIEDCSGLLKPNELAKKCSDLYHKYNADAVVVEVNQGGDYIKNTILGYDNSLRVLEVRAKQDKVKRMLPIANEVYLGKIKAINEKVGLGIATQFRKFTNNGYLGAKGESPDRAEAFAWACFELLGITEYGTLNTIFKPSLLKNEPRGLMQNYNACYLFVDYMRFGLLILDTYDYLGKSHIDIKQAIEGEIENLQEVLNTIEPSLIMINKTRMSIFLSIEVSTNNVMSYKDDLNNEDLILNASFLINNNINVLKCTGEKEYKENLILDRLSKYEKGKEPEALVKSFCYAVLQELK